MSVSYVETRNALVGHDVLRTGVVICHARDGQFGMAVHRGLASHCPFCDDRIFAYAT